MRFPLRSASAALLLLSAPSSALPVQCDGIASDPNAIFQPANFVPLSEFAPKTPEQTLTLTVCPEILEWLDELSTPAYLYVYVDDGGVVDVVEPTDVDEITGEVTLDDDEVEGNCVVVSLNLLHHPYIDTHWSFATQSGRGSYAYGESDGFGTIDFDPQVDANGVTLSQVVEVYDDQGPYAYDTATYNLFSDGTSGNNSSSVRVPAYERYHAENWSTHNATPLAAVWLSDYAREKTGFPIAHRNAATAFSTSSPFTTLQDALPVFQLVHAFEVDPPDDALGYEDGDYAGNEHSLATFFLPPSWTRDPSEAYPVLFHGFYDLNLSTFNPIVGLAMIEALGDVYAHAESRVAIGIVWNGGGAAAAATFNRSAYANAAELFAQAAELLDADPERIVSTGGSRGGTTALAIASNPYGYDYTVRFAHARAPQVRVGTTYPEFFDPTFSGLTTNILQHSGYVDSWEACWYPTGNQFERGRTLALETVFGTDDIDDIDDFLSIDSPPFRERLKCERTEVVLRVGTHDYFGSAALVAEYADHLRDEGVPLLFEIYYRAGHLVPADQAPDDADLLNLVFDCEPPTEPCPIPCETPCPTEAEPCLPQDTNLFARDPGDTSQYQLIVDPDHVPLAFEAPIAAGTVPTCMQPSGYLAPHQTWAFLGEPGTYVRVLLDDSPNPTTEHFTTTLSSTGEIGVDWVKMPGLTTGDWYYRVEYRLPGETEFLEASYLAGPNLTEQKIEMFSIQGQGTSDEERTGGVASDGDFFVP